MHQEFSQRFSQWERDAATFLSTHEGHTKLKCGVRAVMNIMKEWALEDSERPPIFQQFNLGKKTEHSETDKLITVSLMLGIYALLSQYQQNKGRCREWLRWQEPALAPQTPVGLFRLGVPGLIVVRQVLIERCS